jgi:hypothetical protein
MIYRFKLTILFFFITAVIGRTTFDTRKPDRDGSSGGLQVQLEHYPNNDFKRVTAHFSANKSKELVFRVLSSLEQTAQWFQEIDSIKTLTIYSNNHFLLRTVINSPWPFKQRELITCVTTSSKPTVTTIDVVSCSERWPLDNQYVRVNEVSSHWEITATSVATADISYQTWLDPQGYVPAFLFNQELKKSTEKSLARLQNIIASASLQQYSY